MSRAWKKLIPFLCRDTLWKSTLLFLYFKTKRKIFFSLQYQGFKFLAHFLTSHCVNPKISTFLRVLTTAIRFQVVICSTGDPMLSSISNNMPIKQWTAIPRKQLTLKIFRYFFLVVTWLKEMRREFPDSLQEFPLPLYVFWETQSF